MQHDEPYISRCLELASLGLGKIEPGALVGSVIVHKGKIISEGYYEKNGGNHAEINALNAIKDKSLLSDSSLYVSLEPCNHFGKTPPCTEAIIESGIKEVIICNLDSNPKVAGNGVKRLQEADIEVRYGILKQEGEYINRRFLHFHNFKKPYIILKWAESKDGYFAPNELIQKWITSEESKTLTHKWRTEEMAILVGRKTVQIDNPRLTARLWKGRHPLRLFIDRNLEISSMAHIYNNEASTWVFNSKKNESSDHLKFIKLDFTKEILSQIISELYRQEIQSLIVEGGVQTIESFISADLWDEARIISGSEKWEDGRKAPQINGKLLSEDNIASDTLKVILNTH